MKVGYLQFTPVFDDVEKSIEKIESLLSKSGDADLLVIPELSNSGYNFKNRDEAWQSSELFEDSVFIRYLESASKKHNVHLVAGFNERDGSKLFNSTVLVSPDGCLGKYRKIHLFMNEKDYFTPGNSGLPVFEINDCKVGILICLDWLFPEVWRIMALNGVDLVCHPSNLVNPHRAHKAIVSHALCNRYFVITSNRTGTERDLTFGGCSSITDPDGETILLAHESQDEAGIITIDPSRSNDKMITPRNHVLNDRRPKEYQSLCDD